MVYTEAEAFEDGEVECGYSEGVKGVPEVLVQAFLPNAVKRGEVNIQFSDALDAANLYNGDHMITAEVVRVPGVRLLRIHVQSE